MTKPLHVPKRMPVRRQGLGAACALAAALALSTGCATFMNGSTQRVAVASEPPGARVFVGDEPAGVTPTFVELERDEGDLVLRFEKDCHRRTVLEVPRRTSTWVYGNLVPLGVPFNEVTWAAWFGANLFWGGIRALVDRGLGSAWAFPSLVRATLEPLSVAPGAPDSGGTDYEAPGSDDDVEADGGCVPGAAAESGDQGNTPSDR